MLNFPVVPAARIPGPHTPAAPPRAAHVAAVLKAIVAAAARMADRRYRRWKTRRELQALDDRTLHDIGLHRSEIDSIVWSGPCDPHHIELRLR